MTPEERFQRLKNADRWTVNDVRVDLSRLPRRRAVRFVLPALAGLAAVAAGAALVFGAVSLRSDRVQPATPTTTSTSTPSPTPTATPGAITGYAPPNQPFAGDCSAVASITAMTDAAGAAVRVTNTVTTGADSGAEPQYGYVSTAQSGSWAFAPRESGALECAWGAGAKAADLEYIDVSVYPTSAIPKLANQTCGSVAPSESGSHTTDCAVAVSANGLTFDGYVETSSLATSRSLAQKLVPLWTASANAGSPFVASAAAPGTWPLSTDCSAASVASVDGTHWTLAPTPSQGDSGPSDTVEAIMGGRISLFCTAAGSSDDPHLLYSVYGGGAWVLDDAVAKFGATAVDVNGFDHAAVLHSPDGQDRDFVLMTRGSNLLAVEVDDFRGTKTVTQTSTYAISKAVADALDALTK